MILSDSRVKGGDGSNQFHLMIDQFLRNADQLQMLHSSLKMWSSIQNSHLVCLTPTTQEVFQETLKKMWLLGEYLCSDQYICQ